MDPMTVQQFHEWVQEKLKEAEAKKATESAAFVYYYNGQIDALQDVSLALMMGVKHPNYWVDWYAEDAKPAPKRK